MEDQELVTRQEQSPPDPARAEEYERIVARIAAGETAGQEALYEAFGRGVRLYFAHHLRQEDVGDKVHDTFVALVSAIREGQVREPARLPGYVRTIARRQVAAYISEAVRRRSESVEISADLPDRRDSLNPEEQFLQRQQQQLARKILEKLPEIDRQILARFYFEGQTPEQICRDLGLSETQFRLRKSRAKERIAKMTHKSIRRGKLFGDLLLRKKAPFEH